MSLERENARLLAGAAYFSGDEHIRRSAEPWRDATPAERLAAAWELCDWVPALSNWWPDDMRARADALDRLPDDAVDILRRLRAGG